MQWAEVHLPDYTLGDIIFPQQRGALCRQPFNDRAYEMVGGDLARRDLEIDVTEGADLLLSQQVSRRSPELAHSGSLSVPVLARLHAFAFDRVLSTPEFNIEVPGACNTTLLRPEGDFRALPAVRCGREQLEQRPIRLAALGTDQPLQPLIHAIQLFEKGAIPPDRYQDWNDPRAIL
ncbi:hypothetical protein NKH57_18295 [Mesorhizobium sp. M1050]|uniref:hypothetical protein n=1 Tax=Mesorhizobium sp. M1050 TaxID=2957051 RepID=UPI00333D4F96